MNSSLLIKRAFKLGFQNIWRNKLLSIATIFVIGIIIFIFNVVLAINFISQEALIDLNKKIDVVVYLKESATTSQQQSLIKDLENLEETEAVKFTSKEDALRDMKNKHPNISNVFEKYRLGNPLPSSINIITKSASDHVKLETFLQQDKYIQFLSNIKTNTSNTNNPIISSVSKNLVKLSNFADKITFWIIITFIIGSILIIINALQITIFTRKKEIQIMKLVGASHWFIRLPFMIEAIVYGILSIILSAIMLKIVIANIDISGTNLQDYFSSLAFTKVFLYELVATVIIATLSSIIAVHKQLGKI
ncbi:hypothetical protein JKY72_05390 [Candidatus Gracilibacteria bacterium]|nr:hypothetical protein [Candidatus Gracilibacteria bacterium]